MDLNELGRALGEDTMEKTANIFDGFFTKSQSRMIPSNDAADFQTVTDINNMKRNPNVIRDPGMVYHPDGTVSVKPNEVAPTYKPPVNSTVEAGAEAGAGAAAKTEQKIEQKAGGFLSRIGGKGMAIGALGALALGGLGYGAYKAGQNSGQQTATGQGTYQAGPAY